MVTPNELRHLDLGEVTLAVEEAGQGGRPMLALHGWTGAREDLTEFFDPLVADGWHVAAPDQRGHGESSKPEAESAYSFGSFAQDALDLADALGWDRFTLIGHSMGGMVAQTLALSAPERLDALVLVDTHHAALPLDPAVVQIGVEAAREFGTGVIADMMALPSEPGPLDTPANQRLCAQRPGYAEKGARTTRASSSAMFAAMLDEITSASCRLEALRALTLPTLVIVGEQDMPFLEASRAMAEAMEGATLQVVADAGHSPQFEAPEAFSAALGAFLSGVSSSLAAAEVAR